jgi:UDP-N-acetylmuramoylalanine--D-glutamate ligase
LEDAVTKAKEITPKGGYIVLSPAAPSYDAFKDFEERGDLFIKYAKT